MDGSRTHRGPHNDPPPVLKTGEPTGTQPLPGTSIPYPGSICKVKSVRKGATPNGANGNAKIYTGWTNKKSSKLMTSRPLYF
jgi:hypothetical protein